ncbi:MAG: ATP-binding protein [Nevskiaceae bacterium]|jgi:predicted AAA+ superfamily ATPase|nr:ATP-binding protein [Nevskiaceae bacterium]
MLKRQRLLIRIQRGLARSRVVALLGPRQSGKTTLARQIVPVNSQNYFDLEDPTSQALLAEPMTALEKLRGTVVIDEIQRRPDLFPVLRVLADRKPLRARFLILGSASPELLRQSSESLAGRIEMLSISGFQLDEVGIPALDRHWNRGGFPLSFLARTQENSFIWRQQFIQTFLERDVPQLGIGLPASALLRFWTMVAHSHGSIWNSADPARSLGVSESTIRRYLDLFANLLVVRQLQPWHENLTKRQVKAPKVYVRDSGLLHALLGIRTQRELLAHPKSGASWEGYVVEEVLNVVEPEQAYFWATHQGAELDLLLFLRGRRIGVEIKRADAPVITTSMRIALADLRLDRLIVLYPGSRAYDLDPKVRVLPLSSLTTGDFQAALGKTRRRANQR